MWRSPASGFVPFPHVEAGDPFLKSGLSSFVDSNLIKGHIGHVCLWLLSCRPESPT